MIRKMLRGTIIGILVVAAAWVAPVRAGLDSSSTVIVMPARPRLVQLAFQVAHFKDVGLVAYNTSAALSAPLLHVWNGREWVQIGMDEYVSGTFLPSSVGHVFILGDSTSLPAAMTEDPKWAANVHKTADLGTASLLNQFGTVLKFNGLEWRWLAEQNGLILTDRNAERRRYGRWGKSGVDATRQPAKAIEATAMPPAPPVTDIKEPTLPLAPAAPAPSVEAPKTPETTTAPVPGTEVKAIDVQTITVSPAQVKTPEAPKAVAPDVSAVPAAPAVTNSPVPADPTTK